MYIEKATQLKHELQSHQEMHEWTMSQKEKFMNDLQEELDEAEHQLNDAMDGHFITVQDLLGLQTDRVQNAYTYFKTELSVIQSEFDDER
jgi:hypothetical protein